MRNIAISMSGLLSPPPRRHIGDINESLEERHALIQCLSPASEGGSTWNGVTEGSLRFRVCSLAPSRVNCSVRKRDQEAAEQRRGGREEGERGEGERGAST